MRRRVTVLLVCLSVCVCASVKSHLTSGASVCPENAVMYSVGNGGQNIFGVFSETALLQRSSTPSVEGHMYGRPFFLRKALMCIIKSIVGQIKLMNKALLPAYWA